MLLAAVVASAGWTFALGASVADQLSRAIFVDTPSALQIAGLIYKPLLTIAGSILLAIRIPELARRAGIYPARVLVLLSFAVVAGFWLGAASQFEPAFGFWPWGRAPSWRDLWPLAFVCGLVVIGLLYVILPPAGTAEPFFLLDRTHIGSNAARRCLLAIAGHAVCVALLLGWAMQVPAVPGQPYPFPRRLFLFGAAYAVGVLISYLQKHVQRAVGLIPLAALLAVIGAIIAALVPAASWPAWPLGIAAGMVHGPARNWLLVTVPPGQRAGALTLAAFLQILGAIIGVLLFLLLPPSDIIRILILLLLCALSIYLFLRELVEQLTEFVLWPFYPIHGYGPGLLATPNRGPVLVLANHSAWLDPLWLAKVIPLQMRPLMTSKFFDLPLISLLMRRVFHAIRVPETRFRREAPEIQDAIAAIDHGISVLIFPEGYLKRKEDQSLRRFGQGIYQILREKPRTAVVACWIEGGWGSYTSYFKGPPTRNKKMDVRRHIRIGVSEPEVLSLELLHDQLKTRQHLMRQVLNARAFLGLPELPAPPFAAEEDEDEE